MSAQTYVLICFGVFGIVAAVTTIIILYQKKKVFNKFIETTKK